MTPSDPAPTTPFPVRLWLGLLAALTAGALAWMWAGGTGASEVSAPVVVAAWSPSVAAVVAVAVTGGRRGLAALTRPLTRVRIPPRVWAVVLLLPLAIALVARVVLGSEVEHPGPVVQLSALLPGLGAVLAGSLGEELGWRGLAQPSLERRRSVLGAGLVVGVLWATWHCWSVLSPGGGDAAVTDVALTFLRLVPTAVLYAWVLAASGGSLLAVVLAHAAHDVVFTVVPVPEDAPATAAVVAGLYAVAAVVVCLREPSVLRRRTPGRSAHTP